MSKPAARDRFVTVTTTLIVTLLLTILATLWYFTQRAPAGPAPSHFAIIGPITLSTSEFSLTAGVAVQTNAENAEWAEKNRQALRRSVEATLNAVTPDEIHAAEGLIRLQHTLQDAIKRDLGADKVEQVLLTDFLIQTDL